MKQICDVYKSPRIDNMYLYVRHEDALSRVPEALMEKFGEAELALSFMLTEDRRLAREDPEVVLKNLEENGYHLQLPPVGSGLHG